MADLKELYQEVILDHNRNPRNFRKVEGANRRVKGYNPLCGDQYTLYLKMEDDTITDIGFEGSGCAISKASASVMTSMVKGKNMDEALTFFDDFHKLVTGDAHRMSNSERLGKLFAFAGVSEFPARVKCATLAWHTLRAAIEAKEELVTTE
jgi:nitrogen fixation NifU-like protein